jgi:putative holliday junction resolvase
VSDSAGRVATPYEVIERSGDRERDTARLASIVAEVDADVVVVGMPYSLDGTEGRAAKRARAEVRRIAAAVNVPVETYDERLTTVTAERSLRELGLGAAERRQYVDKVAAAVILQNWLDRGDR